MTSRGNFFSIVLVALLLPQIAQAHAAEQGFVLLLPTTFYAVTGTLSVVASMLLVTCTRPGWLERLFRSRRLAAKCGPRGQTAVSVCFTGILLILIAIGLRGPTDPQNNLMPLSFWTLWWIAAFVIHATLLDLWGWINPWTGISRWLSLGDTPRIRLPGAWSAWPAVAVFILFQSFLLADIAPNDPRRLALIVLSYWGITLVGIAIFGRKSWLAQVECLSVMFGLLSYLRALRCRDGLSLGVPGWQALDRPPLDLSRAVFCLVILAAGSFDGLHETFWWLGQIGINPLEFPGRSAVIWTTLWGLWAAIVALIALYAVAIWLGVRALAHVTKSEPLSVLTAFRGFAITLLPIALGYHFAHYFVTFLVQIRVTLSTLADPLARGWDLFGLGAVKVTTGFLSTPETVKLIWLTQAGAVVASHILAVLMSHRIAENNSRSVKETISLQLGISILMVVYTVFGLWLLASPRGV